MAEPRTILFEILAERADITLRAAQMYADCSAVYGVGGVVVRFSVPLIDWRSVATGRNVALNFVRRAELCSLYEMMQIKFEEKDSREAIVVLDSSGWGARLSFARLPPAGIGPAVDRDQIDV